MFSNWSKRLALGMLVALLTGVISVPFASGRADDDDKKKETKQDEKKQDEKKQEKKKQEKKKDDDVSPAKVLAEAQQLAQAGKLKESLEKLEGLVEKRPKNRTARMMAAQLNHMVGIQIVQNGKDRLEANPYLYKCADHMRLLHKMADGKLNPNMANFYAVAIYNQACCLALDGKKEKALKILDESIDAGFTQLETLENDTDFESVKDEKKFKEIIEKLRKKNEKIDT